MTQIDQDLLRTSQEAIDRMVSQGDGTFDTSDELPVRLQNGSEYFGSARPRKTYSASVLAAAEVSDRVRRDDPIEEDHSELSRKAKNLEDLYAMFPRIGDGLYRIRVERLEPKVYNSAEFGRFECSGVLGDFDEPITLDEFQQRFGGTKYRVTVLGPPKPSEPQYDLKGNPFVRTLKSVEFSIQGAPKPEIRPVRQSEAAPADASRQQFGLPMGMGMNYGMGVTLNTEVERERLKNEYLRAEREASERAEANREARQAALQAAQAAALAPAKLVEEVKQQSQQTFEVLRLQNDDLRAQAEKARQESERLRTELITRQQEFERKVRDAENERTAQLKSEFERELRRVTEESARAAERASSSNRDDMARVMSQHALELQRLESNAAKEREMIVRDAERRESSLSKDHDRERSTTRDTYEARIAQLKDTYDARIRDLQLTFERESASVKEAAAREVASIREAREREVEALKSQYEMQSSVSRETTTLRVDMVNNEILRLRDVEARLQQRIDDLEAQNEEMRAKHHKEPLQVITEAKNLLGEIGWAPSAEAPAAEEGEGEGAGDWKKVLARSALGLVDKIPEIAQTVLATRAQQAQAQAQQAQAKAEADNEVLARAQAQQQAQARALAARRQRPALPSPQPMMQPGGMMPSGGAMGPGFQPQPMVQQAPPPRQVVRQEVAPQGPRPGVLQVQKPTQAPREVPTMQPEEQVSQAEQASEQLGEVTETESSPLDALPPEALEEFFKELDKAIREGVIPAGMWAKGFANKIGVPLAKELVKQFPPEQVIEIARGAEDSVIPTRDGQEFVKKIWAEVQKM